jgi:hypothetical protein
MGRILGAARQRLRLTCGYCLSTGHGHPELMLWPSQVCWDSSSYCSEQAQPSPTAPHSHLQSRGVQHGSRQISISQQACEAPSPSGAAVLASKQHCRAQEPWHEAFKTQIIVNSSISSEHLATHISASWQEPGSSRRQATAVSRPVQDAEQQQQQQQQRKQPGILWPGVTEAHSGR